jgi:hypothetical protein
LIEQVSFLPFALCEKEIVSVHLEHNATGKVEERVKRGREGEIFKY